jgi:hypothetical protein
VLERKLAKLKKEKGELEKAGREAKYVYKEALQMTSPYSMSNANVVLL